jgi:hypothetical protein
MFTNAVVPRSYEYYTSSSYTANGSSSTGNCSRFTKHAKRIHFDVVCLTPSSSVLFDGIHTLSTGHVWARHLLTLQAKVFGRLDYYFDEVEIRMNFSTAHRFGLVMVTLFNCPQWGIAINHIKLIPVNHHDSVDEPIYGYNDLNGPSYHEFHAGNCSVLWNVPVNVPVDVSILDSPHSEYKLAFGVSDQNWVHLAEVSFYTPGQHPTSVPPPPRVTTTGKALYKF